MNGAVTDEGGAMEEIPAATTFQYECPEDLANPRTAVRLARSETMTAYVQVLTEGGENNLHSHRTMDGLWFVLGGRARFYTTDDELIGEFGRHGGVFIPKNFPYWFEAVGDEPLELLQVESMDRRIHVEGTDRVGHGPQRPTVPITVLGADRP